MAPADLAGLVIDGLEHARAPNIVICARPSVGSIGRLGKVDAPARMGIHDKQTIFAIETWGTVIGKTTLVGRNKPSIGGRLFGRIRNRTAVLIDSKRPVQRPERSGQQVLAVSAVENNKVAVARGLHQHRLRLAVKVSIDQNWNLDGVPVVRIVRRYLE